MKHAVMIMAVGLAVSSLAAAQTIYRTTDAEGNVVFTDDPDRGGEKVELEPLTVVPSRDEARSAQPPTRAEPAAPNRAATPAAPFMPYDRFAIRAPANESTLPTGAAGNVTVELAIEPALREDHRVRLLLDGQISQSALHTDAFLLNNLPRGEHVLQAELLDAAGEVRHRSETVTLYVQRASIYLPQNPNNPTSGN